MRSATRTIGIEARAEEVYRFLADPERLPVWAIGFAKAVRWDGERWLVTLGGGGEMPIRLDVDPRTRTVDFVMIPAPGVESVAPTRVVDTGTGCQYIFTMFQTPEMSDAMFEAQVTELGRELTVLKAHLESSCPL